MSRVESRLKKLEELAASIEQSAVMGTVGFDEGGKCSACTTSLCIITCSIMNSGAFRWRKSAAAAVPFLLAGRPYRRPVSLSFDRRSRWMPKLSND